MGWLGARGTKLGSDERTLTRTCRPGRGSPHGVSGGMGDRARSWARGRNCPSAAQQRVCSAPCPAAAASAADAKAVPRKRLDKHTAMAAETRKALGMLADDADDAEEEEDEPASAPARPAPAYELPPESPPPQGPAAVTAPTPPPQTHAVPMQPQQQQALQMLLQQQQQQLRCEAANAALSTQMAQPTPYGVSPPLPSAVAPVGGILGAAFTAGMPADGMIPQPSPCDAQTGLGMGATYGAAPTLGGAADAATIAMAASAQAAYAEELASVQAYAVRMQGALAQRDRELAEVREAALAGTAALAKAREAEAALAVAQSCLASKDIMLREKEGQLAMLEHAAAEAVLRNASSPAPGSLMYGGSAHAGGAQGTGAFPGQSPSEGGGGRAGGGADPNDNAAATPHWNAGADGGEFGASRPNGRTLEAEMGDTDSAATLPRSHIREGGAKEEKAVAHLRRQLQEAQEQLRAYDSAMIADFESSLAMEAASSPLSKQSMPMQAVGLLGVATPRSGGKGGCQGQALSSLRALMGEAYLLKMALTKRGAIGADGERAAEVAAALDDWIMASHRLKKAVSEDASGA